jgi:hypothetical protein
MGTFLAVLLGVAAAGYYIWRGFPWKSPASLTAVVQRAATPLLAGLALFSLARGGYTFALVCGAVAFFLGRAQLAKTAQEETGNDAAAAGASRVTTKWLDLTLNRSSGEISGRVLRGRFSGRAIADLSFDDLLSLREEVKASDQQSAAIISAYLDRVHGQAHSSNAQGDGTAGQTQRATVNMSRDEALDVLGLDAAASESEVSEAHRRLMMLVHPDRGGSDYLAAKINAAKSVLLKK